MVFKVKVDLGDRVQTIKVKNCNSAYQATYKIQKYMDLRKINEYKVLDVVEVLDSYHVGRREASSIMDQFYSVFK